MSAQKPAAPAEAPSLTSIVIQAQALTAAVEKLQASINAVLDSQRAPEPQEPAAPAVEQGHPHDRTGNRLRAYVASIRPLRDCIYQEDIEEANHRGRSLIERLALSAEGTDLPRLRLTGEQIADVLSLLSCSEPVEPASWWSDPDDEPSHVVGFYMLLQALEESLRGRSRGTGEEKP